MQMPLITWSFYSKKVLLMVFLSSHLQSRFVSIIHRGGSSILHREEVDCWSQSWHKEPGRWYLFLTSKHCHYAEDHLQDWEKSMNNPVVHCHGACISQERVHEVFHKEFHPHFDGDSKNFSRDLLPWDKLRSTISVQSIIETKSPNQPGWYFLCVLGCSQCCSWKNVSLSQGPTKPVSWHGYRKENEGSTAREAHKGFALPPEQGSSPSGGWWCEVATH